LKYKKYNKGEIIMRQGDKSDEKLYIIYSGSVLIFINKDLDFNNADLK
jgi:CRP-like cAMP-binding protein